MSTRVEVSNRLVFINSASSLVTRLISMSVLIWLQRYLLKRISADEYSLLPVLYSVMMFAPLITTVLTGGLGRYIVESYAKHDDRRITQIVSTMFPILCAAGLAFMGLGCILAWNVDHILRIEPEHLRDARVMLALLMFTAAVRLPLAPFGVGLFVQQKFVLENLIGIGAELFRLSLLFLLLFGVSTRVLWVVLASASAELLNLALVQFFSRRMVPQLRVDRSLFHWPVAKEITAFGGWTFVAGLAATIRSSSDVLILNWFSTPFQVAVFHLGQIPKNQFSALSSQAKRTVLPVITSCFTTGRMDVVRRAFLRSSRYGLWAASLPIIPGLVYGKNAFVYYLGPDYAVCALVMNVSMAVYLFAWPSLLTPELAQAAKRVRTLALNELTLNLVNLAITLLLVIHYSMGAIGSATGTLIATMIFHPLLSWRLGMKLAQVSMRDMLRAVLLPGFAPGILHLVVLGAISLYCPQPTLLWLALLCIFGGIVHGAGVFAIGWWFEDPICAVVIEKAKRVQGMARKRLGFGR